MNPKSFDVLHLLMQPYILDILRVLDEPRRFSEIMKYVRNGRTLSLKLAKLLEFGLVEIVPLKAEKKYVNSYVITKKGKEMLGKLNRL